MVVFIVLFQGSLWEKIRYIYPIGATSTNSQVSFLTKFLWYYLWENDILFSHGGACRTSNHGDPVCPSSGGSAVCKVDTEVKCPWHLARRGGQILHRTLASCQMPLCAWVCMGGELTWSKGADNTPFPEYYHIWVFWREKHMFNDCNWELS